MSPAPRRIQSYYSTQGEIFTFVAASAAAAQTKPRNPAQIRHAFAPSLASCRAGSAGGKRFFGMGLRACGLAMFGVIVAGRIVAGCIVAGCIVAGCGAALAQPSAAPS